MSGFASMGLCPEILQALEEAGYENPTPIQEMAIPPALLGKDIMGCAQTGTGKTAAFTLPMLHRLRNEEPGSLRALILVPTRELAIQVGRNIRTYAQHMKLRTTAVYGGVPMDPQEMMLRYGVDILVATPGRLKDHMWRGNIDYRHTSYLVLDEADRMLDMGFIDAVREIVREIPADRQTMLFSATLDSEIKRLARDILKEPERIEVAPPTSTAEGVEQILINVGHDSKRDVIHQVLALPDMDRTLVFTRTKRGASSLSSYLKSHGHRCTSIHSDKTQERRLEALNAFRDGQVDVLVATDIAARGLDVTGISHVVNFDLPHSPEDYVHRIGRTARAGRKGMAISLMSTEEARGLAAIERHLGRRLALAHLDASGELIMSRAVSAENGTGASVAGSSAGSSAGAAATRGEGAGRSRRSRGGRGRSRGGRSGSGPASPNEIYAEQPVSVATVAETPAREIAAGDGDADRRRPRRRRGGRGRGEGSGAEGRSPLAVTVTSSRPHAAAKGSDAPAAPRRSAGHTSPEPARSARGNHADHAPRGGHADHAPRGGHATQGAPRKSAESNGKTSKPQAERATHKVASKKSGGAKGEPFRALTAKEHTEQLRKQRRAREGNIFTRIITKLGLKGE